MFPQLPVRADKSLWSEVLRVAPGARIVQDGCHVNNDESVLGDDVTTEEDFTARAMWRRQWSDVCIAQNFQDGGFEVRHLGFVEHAGWPLGADDVTHLLVAPLLYLWVVEEEKDDPGDGCGRGLCPSQEQVARVLQKSEILKYNKLVLKAYHHISSAFYLPTSLPFFLQHQDHRIIISAALHSWRTTTIPE